MALIQGGNFTMLYKKQSTVINSFCMDKTPVRTSQFSDCVKQGKCTYALASAPHTMNNIAWQYCQGPGKNAPPPSNKTYVSKAPPGSDASKMEDDPLAPWNRQCEGQQPPYDCNYGSDRVNHPMNCVSFGESSKYCAAQGKRLPTEAEWELAARGLDSRPWPWGEAKPVMKGPDIQGCWAESRADDRTAAVHYTCAIGAFPKGKTPEGVEDLLSNVQMWTTGTDDGGAQRFVRGATYGWGFGSPSVFNSTPYRSPTTKTPELGFRCVR